MILPRRKLLIGAGAASAAAILRPRRARAGTTILFQQPTNIVPPDNIANHYYCYVAKKAVFANGVMFMQVNQANPFGPNKGNYEVQTADVSQYTGLEIPQSQRANFQLGIVSGNQPGIPPALNSCIQMWGGTVGAIINSQNLIWGGPTPSGTEPQFKQMNAPSVGFGVGQFFPWAGSSTLLLSHDIQVPYATVSPVKNSNDNAFINSDLQCNCLDPATGQAVTFFNPTTNKVSTVALDISPQIFGLTRTLSNTDGAHNDGGTGGFVVSCCIGDTTSRLISPPYGGSYPSLFTGVTFSGFQTFAYQITQANFRNILNEAQTVAPAGLDFTSPPLSVLANWYIDQWHLDAESLSLLGTPAAPTSYFSVMGWSMRNMFIASVV